MAIQERKEYQCPEAERLTLITPEELASLSVDDPNGELQTYSNISDGGASEWTPWV